MHILFSPPLVGILAPDFAHIWLRLEVAVVHLYGINNDENKVVQSVLIPLVVWICLHFIRIRIEVLVPGSVRAWWEWLSECSAEGARHLVVDVDSLLLPVDAGLNEVM